MLWHEPNFFYFMQFLLNTESKRSDEILSWTIDLIKVDYIVAMYFTLIDSVGCTFSPCRAALNVWHLSIIETKKWPEDTHIQFQV